MTENPLIAILRDQMPDLDFGVMHHGFADHGRDYVFIVEIGGQLRPGTYELIFTHVVQLDYKTRVRDDVWGKSWGDEFTDYRAWEAAGEPDGYIFGTNWSLAYPGVTVLAESAEATDWSGRLGKQMFAAKIETDRFGIVLVYSGARLRQISTDSSTVDRVVIPLAPPG